MNTYDFPVALQQVRLMNDPNPIPNVKCIVRTDTQKPLQIVSDTYRLFTHGDAVKTTEKFLASFGAHEVKDFVEKDGLRFVRQCTFKNNAIKVGDAAVGDLVNFRLMIANSYDKKSSVRIKIAAMVLKCTNGMTVPGGSLDLSFRHTESIRNLELPDPEKVLSIFNRAGEQWNDWFTEKLSSSQRDAILHLALEQHIVGERVLAKHDSLLNPEANDRMTFWQYFNNFTNVITHHLPKVQLTAKIVRLDRLNSIFNRVLHGEAQPGFTDEENE